MTDAATRPVQPTDADRSLLRWLSLAHFVLAVATLYFVYAGYLRLQAGFEVVEHPEAPIPAEFVSLYDVLASTQRPGAPQQDSDLKFLVGLVLVLLGAALIALSLVHAVVLALVGRWIVRHNHRKLCVVFSYFDLTYFPLGTILSVFALIVLNRPGVKQLFQPRPSPPPLPN